jgi:CBS domain-containing protein
MKLIDILGRKGRIVVTIDKERSVLEAARSLVQHNIGALVVTEGDRPKGIITERDILRLTARDPGGIAGHSVEAVMTRDLVTATPDDDLSEAMGVMTHRRIRHLPVMNERRLVGIVSIGDLINACLGAAEHENMHMRQYIQGAG